MRQGHLTKQGERGVATAVVAIMATVLVAAAGLGIDGGSLAYQRAKVQNSADAGALLIGYECVKKTANCSSGTAPGYAAANTTHPNSETSSTTVPGGVSLASTSVTVEVTKTVATRFFGLLGTDSKNVTGRATAKWSDHPTAAPVLPFAVSMCNFANAGLNTETLIRADINDASKDTIVRNGNTTADEAYANMQPFLAPECTPPEGVTLPGSPTRVKMLTGGLWMSQNGNAVCNGSLLPTTILESLEIVKAYNEVCSSKYADYLSPGKLLTVAIYAPTSNYENAGIRISGGKAVHPAEFDMRLVGYAPFIVSGWCLGKGAKSCGGASPGATGFMGKFIRSAQNNPDFDYGTDGVSFGAYQVKLSD